MGFFACGLATAPDTRLALDWEEPRCLLCNGKDGSILVEAPDPLPSVEEGRGGSSGLWFAVNQCQDCGLCYTCPRPVPEDMNQFYGNNYPPHDKFVKRGRRGWLPRRSRISGLERSPVHGQGRLLDFGCGNGAFLLRMQDRGWNVTGIDTSETVVQNIRAKLGLSVLGGSLPHPELCENSFDLITMRHSLEHVHQPLEVLRSAYQLLAPGGQLVVAAPNIDSFAFKWFGRDWRGLDLPRHLTHFTPDTLQLMLARAGFDVGPVRMVRQPQMVRRSAQLANRRVNATFWQRSLRSRLLAGLATWYAYLARRSDAMIVTSVKSNRAKWEQLSAFSLDFAERPRFPADRWRSK